MFIESNTTGSGAALVKLSQLKGLEVLFLCRNPSRYPFLKDLDLLPIVIDTKDREELWQWLRDIPDIRAILSNSDAFIGTAAWLSRMVGLNASDPELIANIQDKQWLFETLTGSGFMMAKSSFVHYSKIESQCRDLCYPLIVKPRRGSGSANVRYCSNEGDLRNWISDIKKSDTVMHEDGVLLQNYIIGDEYSIETIGDGKKLRVIGITKKYLGDLPYFVECGHDFPAQVEANIQNRIESTVLSALQVLGLLFGPAHTEIKVVDNEVVLIEINPRPGGGMIPELIKLSIGLDILQMWIEACIHGGFSFPNAKVHRHAAVRFLIPESEGSFASLPVETGQNPRVALYNPIETAYRRKGDFRDRIGYVLYFADTPEHARSGVERALKEALGEVKVQSAEGNNGGRLRGNMDHVLKDVLMRGMDQAWVNDQLGYICRIDQAHVLMLLDQNLLPKEAARAILAQTSDLVRTGFESIRNRVGPRGAYQAYESFLVDRIGMKQAGGIHLGRSRNDINATIVRLCLRDQFIKLFRLLFELRMTMILKAEEYRDCFLPVASQFQPAMPGCYAYYLLAGGCAFERVANGLLQIVPEVNKSPLGAGGGAGTDIKIDPKKTARLLGFESVSRNALDAVANRDLVLQFLSCLSIMGTTISRMSQDYQLWTMYEIGWFSLPDELCGVSSIMPQKKNPFILEVIKGKASRITARLIEATYGMQKVPYANSFEVGTEALRGVPEVLEDAGEMIRLMKLIISKAKPIRERIDAVSRRGMVHATLIVNRLVEGGPLNFREAHNLVGGLIRQSIEEKRDVLELLEGLAPEVVHRTLLEFAGDLEVGGGPGQESLGFMLEKEYEGIRAHALTYGALQGAWSSCDELRMRRVVKTISSR